MICEFCAGEDAFGRCRVLSNWMSSSLGGVCASRHPAQT